MREDPDLVQMLTQIDLDREIPPSLYKVVAELLAFVYRLNQKLSTSRQCVTLWEAPSLAVSHLCHGSIERFRGFCHIGIAVHQ